MPTNRNIIVGAAGLWISTRDSTSTNAAHYDTNGDFIPAPLPTATATASLVPALEGSADWRNVGYTSEGLTVSYEPTYNDVEVDQLLDSARVFKASMRVTLATSFTEATLENLIVVWGQSASTLSSTATEAEAGIAADSLGDDSVERALVAVGPAPRAVDGKKRERVYYARRVLSVDTTAQAIRRAEATMFPVTFRLLPLSPNSVNGIPAGKEYGFVRDRNNSA